MESATKLHEELWRDTQKISVASLYHPFVLKIAQGTLDQDKFQSYMGQDEYFLNVMGQCFTAMKQKCPQGDAITQEMIAAQTAGALAELELHGDVLKSERPNLVLNSAAKNYTEFLKDVASAELPGYLAAAMTPCPVLYSDIGKKIAVASPYRSDPEFNVDLQKWIATYYDTSVENSCEAFEKLLDRLGSDLSYQKLHHYYRQALVLEYMFFDAYNVADDTCPPLCDRFSSKKILLLLDFDKTLTVSDTSDLIGRTAVKANQTGSKAWDLIAESYYAGFKFVKQKLSTAKSIRDYCQIINDYENESKSSLIQGSALSGLTPDHFRAMSQCVQLRDGARELLEKSFNKLNLQVKVLSSNWSSTFIKSTLGKERFENSGNFEVISHNLLLDANNFSTGVIVGATCGPVDKEKLVETLKTPNQVTVYVGDSIIDILALLAVDIGIIVGNDEKVLDFCKKYDILVLPLVSYMIDPECQQKQKCKVVFKADSLFEVNAFLYGVHREEIILSKYPENTTPTVLTIGGSDSGGCSGIQADLKTFEAHGVFGMSSLSSITTQSTIGVADIDNVDPFLLHKQISCVLNDVKADVIKTGMLPTPESVSVVVKAVADHRIWNLVVDPVVKSSTGSLLSSSETLHRMITELFPLTYIATPNISEASMLLTGKSIKDIDDMKEAAREIHLLGPKWVLIKGGHLENLQGYVSDLLYDGVRDIFHQFSNRMISTRNNRGTGCTLASAIASNIARQMPMIDAVSEAREYVYQLLRHSTQTKIGRGPYGPMTHSFNNPAHVDNKNAMLNSALALYLVTDDLMIEDKGLRIEQAVEEAILGGTTIVQIRCKSGTLGDFCSKVRSAQVVCKKHNVPLLVNDRVDLAMACNADGVHIGQSDIKLKDARRLLGPTKIIGVSATTLEEAREAETNGADYLGVGTVFSTATKTDISDLIGLDGLRSIVSAVSIPTVAIGGISKSNTIEVMECKVSGIAVVSAILKADSIEFASRELKYLVNEVKGNQQFVDEEIPANCVDVRRRLIKNSKRCVVIDDSVQDVKNLDVGIICEKVASCGFSAIQIKCRFFDGAEFTELAKNFASKCKAPGISVFVNDRVDVAVISEADGVHLEGNSTSMEAAALLTGDGKIVGVSVACSEEAAEAERSGADYVTVDCGSPDSWENLMGICRATNVPVFAVGKIGSKDLAQLLSHGASGVIVPLEILDSLEDIQEGLNLLKD